MRIALLSHASAAGAGGEHDLAAGLPVHGRALLAMGHEVRVFAAGAAPGLRTAREDGLEVTRFARDGALQHLLAGLGGGRLHRLGETLAEASEVLAALRRELQRGRFDAIEIVGDPTAAALVALCDGLPVVVRVTGPMPAFRSGAERLIASRLARHGLRAARAVSTPSAWLRSDLERGGLLDRTAFVVPDGVETGDVQAVEELPGVLRELADDAWLLGCVGEPEGSFAGFLARARAEHTTLAEVFVEHGGDSTRRACLHRAQAVMFWGDTAPTAPPVLLEALAAGVPILAPAVGAIPEVLRDDVDGLLFDGGDDALRKLGRLVRTDSLRERLSRSAVRRAAARHDPGEVARRRLTIYALAADRREVIAGAELPANGVELGPDDWFEAWWLTRTEPVLTRLARRDDGKLALLDLAVEDLKVVDSLLVRAWCDGPALWDAPEWQELRELGEQAVDRLAELRAAGGEGDGVVRLALPPVDHPMFDAEQPGLLLDEIWRLEGHPGFADWLVGAVCKRGFAARAADNVHLRRVAVEAARRDPGAGTFGVLRRIYRQSKRRDRVVEADREFLERSQGADAFARGIDELGLHAPSARRRFPSGRGRGSSGPGAEPARVTVLIPSYRHERYVVAAIESCLRQSVAAVRVLVADDRSPDRTVELARGIDDPRVVVHVNPRNVGLGASVRDALGMVDTPFVALLNSDDLFHPDRLARCLEVFDRDPDAQLVATGFRVVDAKDRILDHANSCAVDIGPQAHGWLRWFERVTDELRGPEDWTSFETLLRHNVLATSSNMVFRTPWLVEHMPGASDLKYCLDWDLFLSAALGEALRMVPEPLLAYRLHDANTVWFKEGGRADYVMEVNRVVDRVLGAWLERRVSEVGAPAAVARLAEVLEHDVALHGETDGLALYLSGLARRLGDGAVDHEVQPITELADAALRRKTFAQVMQTLDVDPWSLPWRSRTADRWQLEHEAANGFQARADALGQECSRVKIELETRRREAEDAGVIRARVEAELEETRERDEAQLRGERAVREAAVARGERLAEDLRLREQELEETGARLRSSEEAVAHLTVARDALVAERDGLRADLAQREERVAELVERLRDTEARLAAQIERRDQFRRELEVARSERERAREDARSRGRVRDRAVDAVLAARVEALHRAAAPEWRIGELLLRRLRLLPVFKTLQGAWRRSAERARRGTWHVRRILSAAGRDRRRVVVFAGEALGSPFGWRPVLEALRHGGRDVRLVAWSHGGSDAEEAGFPAAPWRAVRPLRVRMTEDRRLAEADRRYFERRIPDNVRELVALLGEEHPFVGRAFRGARTAKALGAGVGIAHGLRSAAVQAFAARILSGIPYVLVLADEDIADGALPGELVRRIVVRADRVVADSAPVLQWIREQTGEDLADALLRWPLSVFEVAPSAGADSPAGLRACVPWAGWRRADVGTLVRAIRAAVDRGVGLHVDILGAPPQTRPAVLVLLELQDGIDELGLGGRVEWLGERGIDEQNAALSRCDVVLWAGRDAAGGGVPTGVLDAMAAGRPVVASSVASWAAWHGVADAATLVPPGDARALADALVRSGEIGSTVEGRQGLIEVRDDAEQAFRAAVQSALQASRPNR